MFLNFIKSIGIIGLLSLGTFSFVANDLALVEEAYVSTHYGSVGKKKKTATSTCCSVVQSYKSTYIDICIEQVAGGGTATYEICRVDGESIDVVESGNVEDEDCIQLETVDGTAVMVRYHSNGDGGVGIEGTCTLY